MDPLESLVEKYLSSDGRCCSRACDPVCANTDEFIFVGLELDAAITLAALSTFNGKRHSHQRRLNKGVLMATNEQLSARHAELRKVSSFKALHDIISAVVNNIRGAGTLYAYDVAARIGRSLSLEPEMVYLHAGAREGARYLGVRSSPAQLTEFPKAMHRLTPAQAEDFLCIRKAELAKFARNRSR